MFKLFVDKDENTGNVVSDDDSVIAALFPWPSTTLAGLEGHKKPLAFRRADSRSVKSGDNAISGDGATLLFSKTRNVFHCTNVSEFARSLRTGIGTSFRNVGSCCSTLF